MKRTDFSVDWLFAACAPATELLPWNAQFTPVDLPHDWQIRHADDLYRDGTLFYRKYFFVTDVPGTRRMLWFGGGRGLQTGRRSASALQGAGRGP